MFKRLFNYLKLLIPVNREKYEINKLGDKEWHLNGYLHREDGPAIEYASGRKEWHINGHLHRIDGPAYEGANGSKAWFINDKLHRLDGPACEYVDRKKTWFIDGKSINRITDFMEILC